MTDLSFAGVAPIPKGTRVKVLVDDPNNPKAALQIEDLDRSIKYSVRDAPRQAEMHLQAIVQDYLFATVEKVIVYAHGNQTVLTLTSVEHRQ